MRTWSRRGFTTMLIGCGAGAAVVVVVVVVVVVAVVMAIGAAGTVVVDTEVAGAVVAGAVVAVVVAAGPDDMTGRVRAAVVDGAGDAGGDDGAAERGGTSADVTVVSGAGVEATGNSAVATSRSSPAEEESRAGSGSPVAR